MCFVISLYKLLHLSNLKNAILFQKKKIIIIDYIQFQFDFIIICSSMFINLTFCCILVQFCVFCSLNSIDQINVRTLGVYNAL